VENVYGISIFEKTKLKEKVQKVKVPYKRKPLLWQQYEWEVA
jgi:hypothetical protein